jgi:hypothetical protein
VGAAIASTENRMRQGLLIASLSFAVIAIVGAIWTHTRLKASATDRWSARGSLLLSIGIVIGILPGLFFPRASGLSITGSLVSLVFTAGSFVTLRHMRRRMRATVAHDARR